FYPQRFEQRLQGWIRTRQSPPVAAHHEADSIGVLQRSEESVRAFDLRTHRFQWRRGQAAVRSGARTLAGRGRRALALRGFACLADQSARRDQAGDPRIAKLMQQAPYVAIDRLLPSLLPCLKVAADHCGPDPRIDRRAIKRHEATLAVSGD